MQVIKEVYPLSTIIELGQGISIIPFTEQLYDEINKFVKSDTILSFEYFTSNIEQQILKTIGLRKIAYVEAEYFGGEGGQIGIIWEDGQRVAEF